MVKKVLLAVGLVGLGVTAVPAWAHDYDPLQPCPPGAAEIANYWTYALGDDGVNPVCVHRRECQDKRFIYRFSVQASESDCIAYGVRRR